MLLNNTSAPTDILVSPWPNRARLALKTAFVSSQWISDGLSLGLAIYTQFSCMNIALAAGIISGSLSAATTWGFKGPVIDEYFAHDNTPVAENAIRLPKPLIKLICWLYTPARLLQEFGMNYFILGSLLAWINAFKQHLHLRLTAMSPQALVGVIIYTFLINVPFVLSNEIVETCESIAQYGEPTDDGAVISPLLRPLWVFRYFISTVGAITHSLEHLANLLLLIPPLWILSLHPLTQLSSFVGVVSIVSIASLLFLVHLVQTYFFEGRHTLNNLTKLNTADIENEKTYEIKHNTEYEILKLSHHLLDTQSVFHAADDARLVLLTVATAGYPQAAMLLGALQFLIVCAGIQCSSIYESKKATAEALNAYENNPVSPQSVKC